MAWDESLHDYDDMHGRDRRKLPDPPPPGYTTDGRPLALKDSGTRTQFNTGAVRDGDTKKGRFDLLPYWPLKRFAQHMGKGAEKYEARNWEKGIPLSRYLNSAENHLQKLKAGFDDEPHADAVLWNIACYIETVERIRHGILPAELDDMPNTWAGKDPGP